MVGVCKRQREKGRYRFQKVIVLFVVGLATDDASGSQAHLTIKRHIYLVTLSLQPIPLVHEKSFIYSSHTSILGEDLFVHISNSHLWMLFWTPACIDTEHSSLTETFHYLEL